MKLKFLLLLALIIISAGDILTKQRDTNQQPVALRNCAVIENIIDQITCYVDIAKKTDDLTQCDEADKDAIKYQCYAIFAEHKKDASLCNQIPVTIQDGQQLRDVCKLDVVKEKMNIASDVTICETIVTHFLDDECYEVVVKGTGDQSLCERILENSIKDRCYDRPTFVE